MQPRPFIPLPPAERVPGTEWLEVTCDDGKKYFHNPKTDETTWHVPPEVRSGMLLCACRRPSCGRCGCPQSGGCRGRPGSGASALPS